MTNTSAENGWLVIRTTAESIAIELGDAADDWLQRIRNPRSRIEKLGVTPGMQIAILGCDDDAIVAEISHASGERPFARLRKGLDLVLLFAPDVSHLARLASIEPKLNDRGAVWVQWPKGRRDFGHEEVAAAGDAGLVQSKSMGFSDRYTGLRLIRPAIRSRTERPE
jgi:hypothetical protein